MNSGDHERIPLSGKNVWCGTMNSYLDYVSDDEVERARYLELREDLASLRQMIAGKTVLDFGAASGMSICALIESGAAKVVGTEPDPERAKNAGGLISSLRLNGKASIIHTSYEAGLPFHDECFEVVLANAVLEHIPVPRSVYIRELWRVLSPNGYLIINETPNKYLPIDFHTTGGLWFVPWLPSSVARRYAIWRGRFRADADWRSSGWRGIGYYELIKEFNDQHVLIPETSRPRHRLLSAFGLPPSLLDPYPTFVFCKASQGATGQLLSHHCLSRR